MVAGKRAEPLQIISFRSSRLSDQVGWPVMLWETIRGGSDERACENMHDKRMRLSCENMFSLLTEKMLFFKIGKKKKIET